MQYKEFLDHIYQKYSGNVKLELDRMAGLLEEIGQPQRSLRGFHVAGTNGKGSVCATLEALALAHGLRTGLNTSPHLVDYTERFRLDGRELPFQRVLDTFLRHERAFEKWEASFFEITTAIAFQVFRDEEIDTAVIEVGLGGRLDATNLFTPDVAVITTIGLDHVKTLGNSVELIAAEKAGIVKPGVPLVLGKLDAGPRWVITAKAEEQGAPVYRLGREFRVTAVKQRISGLRFDYRFGEYSFQNLRSNLIGSHQAGNLSLALTAFILYAQKRGLKISETAVRQALGGINWRGRMQVLSVRPPIIIDGAHNVQGVQALVDTLARIWPGRRFRFLISILADKNFKEMIKLFCGLADKVYIAQNQSDRAATAAEQAAEVRRWEVAFQVCPSVAEAFDLARRELGPGDVLICGGSLYTVGEILSRWQGN